jgi:hypothetical protein
LSQAKSAVSLTQPLSFETIFAERFMSDKCSICGCELHRNKNTYARATPEGRSHASRHHFVPERFFGRSSNRRGTKREGIFQTCPWGYEGKGELFCYDCHEELIHNPVFLPDDIKRFARLVAARGFSESKKTESKNALAGRIKLLHEVIDCGLEALLRNPPTPNRIE